MLISLTYGSMHNNLKENSFVLVHPLPPSAPIVRKFLIFSKKGGNSPMAIDEIFAMTQNIVSKLQ